MGLRTRVIACSVVLTAVTLAVVPGGRSFASDVAAKIAHLRSPRTGGPIPFILDLRKHAPKTHAARPHAPVQRGHVDRDRRAKSPARPPAPASQ